MRLPNGLDIPLRHEMKVIADFSNHWTYDHAHHHSPYLDPDWHDVELVLVHPDYPGCWWGYYHVNGLRRITASCASRLMALYRQKSPQRNEA